MQGRTFRGQSPDGTWHEGFLIRSPGVKNSRPGEGWYINSEQEPAYAHLVKPFTIGMSTGVKDMEGTMVFEGDIIKTTGSNERIFSVEFGEYIAYGVGHIGFYAKIAGKNSRDYNPCCLRALLCIGKVVGNMSDTPYLMKEAGEEQKKMKWTETITPKQAAEELGVPYHGWMREMDRAWISEDQKYSVMSRLLRTEWGKVEHVTITAAEGVGRSDGSGDIPWAVKMEIKNDLFGEKRVAVEVFPTQDRLVDVCDCYHLWVFEKGFQLPFGIHPRDEKPMVVNRGSTRVRAVDGQGQEYSIKELLERNGAADMPKRAYADLMAGYMAKNNLLGG